jgi:hypothetical protein
MAFGNNNARVNAAFCSHLDELVYAPLRIGTFPFAEARERFGKWERSDTILGRRVHIRNIKGRKRFRVP